MVFHTNLAGESTQSERTPEDRALQNHRVRDRQVRSLGKSSQGRSRKSEPEDPGQERKGVYTGWKSRGGEREKQRLLRSGRRLQMEREQVSAESRQRKKPAGRAGAQTA